MNRRRFLTTSLPLAALTASGCIGSFALTRRVYDWNRGMGSPIVQEIIFLIFVFVLPVYSIVLTIDAVLLNTIEFLTGKNPVAKGEDDDAEVVTELDQGARMRLRRRRGHLEVTVRQPDGTGFVHRFEAHSDGVRVWDEDDALVADARFDGLGGIVIYDRLGRELSSFEEALVSETAFAYEEQGAEAAIDTAFNA